MPTSKHIALVIATLLVSACWNRRKVEIVSSGEVVATSVEAQTGSTLPAGADMRVRLDQTLTLNETKAGDLFSMTVSSPVMAMNGDVVVPRGARVHGKIRRIDPATNGSLLRIAIEVEALEVEGKRFPMQANIIEMGESSNKNAFVAGMKMTLRVSEPVLLR
jgi:hypothetical protein